MLIETEKTADCNKPNLVAPDPLDIRNLNALRRLRDERHRLTISARPM
jgi:hypothetical protein